VDEDWVPHGVGKAEDVADLNELRRAIEDFGGHLIIAHNPEEFHTYYMDYLRLCEEENPEEYRVETPTCIDATYVREALPAAVQDALGWRLFTMI
jgi:hypothetical protein